MKKILNRNGGGANLLSSPSSEGILYYNRLLKSGGGGAQNNLCASFNDFRGLYTKFGGERYNLRLTSNEVFLCQA